MASVDPVSISTALDQQSKTASSSTALAGDFDDFLKLLTTQLQNQDPLNPMDTTQFTNQLVGFAGVEQQINSNQKLDNLISLGIGSALGSAQSYVGKEISYVSNDFNYTGEPMKIKYSLDSATTSTKISILDEDGDVLYTADGSKLTGANDFTWDGTLSTGGKAGPGTYQIKIDALDADGKAVDSTAVVSGFVRGTEVQDGQIFVLVGDRAVALSNVLNTNAPDTNANASALTTALNYVGLDVSYQDSELAYAGSGAVPITYQLDNDAVQSQLLVKNSAGETVYTMNVARDAGVHEITWSGKLSDGTQAPADDYTVSIDAIDGNDNHIGTRVVGQGRVTGVETNNGQIYLNVGSSKSIPLINVLSADKPTEDA